MRITLTVTGGAHKGKMFTFVGHDTFIVGRSPKSHFRLSEEDRYFSRFHFLVEANPPRCRLLDMNSRNGTYVNGQRVGNCELFDGDKIQAGRTVIRVAFQQTESLASLTVAPPDIARDEPQPASPSPTRPEVRRTSRTTGVPGTPPVCLACGEPTLAVDTDTLSLCPGCQEKSRSQRQPIAGYRVIEEIGNGAMGVVALAIRLADGLRVALKTVTPAMAVQPNQLSRFLREAKILSQLRHPNIVAYHEMGGSDEQLWFAMDYVRGADACQLLREQGPFEVGRAVRLACQLLDALAHAHSKKFVHRDIKPSNVLVQRTANGEQVKLADFGLARVYQASQLSGLTMSGEIGGTLGFMAPEQITDFREAEPPADLYSAAATLYNVMTGTFIFDFEGDLKQRLLAILQEDTIPIRKRRREIPQALAAAIHRGLEREPHRRWQDASSFRAALLPFADQ
jgi:eukaryotic-like serine/threonine-protein kinase